MHYKCQTTTTQSKQRSDDIIPDDTRSFIIPDDKNRVSSGIMSSLRCLLCVLVV